MLSSNQYKLSHNYIHIFESGNPLIAQTLAFRDWLRAHPDEMQRYETIKKQLATIHIYHMQYCNAKTDFIQSILAKIKQQNIS